MCLCSNECAITSQFSHIRPSVSSATVIRLLFKTKENSKGIYRQTMNAIQVPIRAILIVDNAFTDLPSLLKIPEQTTCFCLFKMCQNVVVHLRF